MVAVLCATEITSWGVLFYAFPVLVTSIHDDEGWSVTSLFGAFTVAQLIAAGVGIWVGRRIDTHGPRGVMTAGSVVGVVATVAIASAPTLPTFFLAWAVAGLAMSATLYAPAFAAVTGWAGTDARARVRGLTAVTLVAGFSSTLFAPLTALLLDRTDWRGTYLVLVVVLAATVPAHWFGLRPPWTPLAPAAEEAHDPADAPVSWRSAEFLLLTLAVTLAGFTVFASIVNLVPLLTQHGLSTTAAAVALGVSGAGQVAGRLLYGPLLTRLTIRRRTLVAFGSVAVTTAALAVVQSPLVAVLALAFVAGSARGIYTLIQATSVSDRWGITGYGVRNGIVSGAVMAATALAPYAGAVLAAALGDYAAAFLGLAAATVVSLVIVAVSDRPRPSPPAPRR
ncbi:MAG: MFS transporter [Nocardioidaceae bacterium]|nr:MFS transporter [Nocardioidaceae bacterium]